MKENMVKIKDFVEVVTLNINGVNIVGKECVIKHCINGKKIKIEKVDEAHFEFDDNYCNKIFVSREVANKLYKVLKTGEIKSSNNSFEFLSNSLRFLKENGCEFKVGM